MDKEPAEKQRTKGYKQMLSFHNRKDLCSSVNLCTSTCGIQEKDVEMK